MKDYKIVEYKSKKICCLQIREKKWNQKIVCYRRRRFREDY